MSISQIDPTLGAGAQYNLEAVSVWANTNAIGHDRCSLTEWDTTTVPALAAGSIFEVAGAYYSVDSDTAITVGAVSDGFVFIVVDTSTPAVPTLYFTNTVPTWDDAKQGYYIDIGGGTLYKVLPFRILKYSTSYSKFNSDPESRIKISNNEPEFEIGFAAPKAVSATGSTWVLVDEFDDIIYNKGNYSSGVFTADISGLYKFEVVIDADTGIYFMVAKNDYDILSFSVIYTPALVSIITTDVFLNAGETIKVFRNGASGNLNSSQVFFTSWTFKSVFKCTRIG